MLIFPEGRRTETGEIDRFRPGIGMIASRLGVPVVPVRIEGLDKVLHHTWRMARPGRVRVAFGAPMRLVGDDYEATGETGRGGGKSVVTRLFSRGRVQCFTLIGRLPPKAEAAS